jgi:predicted RNA polymerase sigma factor
VSSDWRQELNDKAHACAENARDILNKASSRQDDPTSDARASIEATAAAGAGALATGWATLGQLYATLARD